MAKAKESKVIAVKGSKIPTIAKNSTLFLDFLFKGGSKAILMDNAGKMKKLSFEDRPGLFKTISALKDNGKIVTELGGSTDIISLMALKIGVDVFSINAGDLRSFMIEMKIKEKGIDIESMNDDDLKRFMKKFIAEIEIKEKSAGLLQAWNDIPNRFQKAHNVLQAILDLKVIAQQLLRAISLERSMGQSMSKSFEDRYILDVVVQQTGAKVEKYVLENLNADPAYVFQGTKVKALRKELTKKLKEIPFWKDQVQYWRGWGPRISGIILGGIVRIERFPTANALRSYSGCAGPRKKQKGVTAKYNHSLWDELYMLGDQYNRAGDGTAIKRLILARKLYISLRFIHECASGLMPEDVRTFQQSGKKLEMYYKENHGYYWSRSQANDLAISWMKSWSMIVLYELWTKYGQGNLPSTGDSSSFDAFADDSREKVMKLAYGIVGKLNGIRPVLKKVHTAASGNYLQLWEDQNSWKRELSDTETGLKKEAKVLTQTLSTKKAEIGILRGKGDSEAADKLQIEFDALQKSADAKQKEIKADLQRLTEQGRVKITEFKSRDEEISKTVKEILSSEKEMKLSDDEATNRKMLGLVQTILNCQIRLGVGI